MKKVLIRPKDIKNSWETDDACIVEQYDGRRWICEKFLESIIYLDGTGIITTIGLIRAIKEDVFLELSLIKKGKSE